jgi:hypothetical protein
LPEEMPWSWVTFGYCPRRQAMTATDELPKNSPSHGAPSESLITPGVGEHVAGVREQARE